MGTILIRNFQGTGKKIKIKFIIFKALSLH